MQREQLGHVQKELRRHFRDISWTRPEAMHLTLLFLGDVEPAALPALRQALESTAATAAAFDLELDGLGSFGERVIWAGVRKGLAELTNLADKVRRQAGAAGSHREEKPFNAHVTLGRTRHRGRIASVLARMPKPPAFEPWRVGEIELIRSELLPQGARYSTLGTFTLAG